MSRIRRILHPIDFSRASSAAYKRAVGMASRAGPRGPLMADGYVSPKLYEDMEAAPHGEVPGRGARRRSAGAP